MNQKAKNLFIVIVLLVFLLLGILVKDYMGPIVLAFITSLLLHPVYTTILKVTLKNKPISLTITMLILVITIIIPLLFISQVVISQAKTITSDAIDYISTSEVLSETAAKYDKYADRLALIGVELKEDQIKDEAVNLIKSTSKAVFNKAVDLGGASSQIISKIIVYFTLVGAFLNSNKKIKKMIFEISPFNNNVNSLYYDRISTMMKSMFTGVLPATFAQVIITIIAYKIVGVPYLGLIFILMMFTGFLPFGTGILTLPIALLYLLLGMYWQAILLLVVYYVIVINVDNIIRAKMAERVGKVDSALMMLALFGGVAQFGFMGIIYGPVIMMLAMTTLQVYREYYKDDLSS